MKTLASFFIFVWIALIFGWIANIVQIISHMGEPVTTTFIVKVVGIFAAPVGSVLGLIGLF